MYALNVIQVTLQVITEPCLPLAVPLRARMVLLVPERPDIRRQPVGLFLAHFWGKVERGANLSLGQAERGQVPSESEVTNHGFATTQEQVAGFDIPASTG